MVTTTGEPLCMWKSSQDICSVGPLDCNLSLLVPEERALSGKYFHKHFWKWSLILGTHKEKPWYGPKFWTTTNQSAWQIWEASTRHMSLESDWSECEWISALPLRLLNNPLTSAGTSTKCKLSALVPHYLWNFYPLQQVVVFCMVPFGCGVPMCVPEEGMQDRCGSRQR